MSENLNWCAGCTPEKCPGCPGGLSALQLADMLLQRQTQRVDALEVAAAMLIQQLVDRVQELAALKEDADRLDWLSNLQQEEGWIWYNFHRVNIHKDGFYSKVGDVQIVEHKTLREAIDATRAVKRFKVAR